MHGNPLEQRVKEEHSASARKRCRSIPPVTNAVRRNRSNQQIPNRSSTQSRDKRQHQQTEHIKPCVDPGQRSLHRKHERPHQVDHQQQHVLVVLRKPRRYCGRPSAHQRTTGFNAATFSYRSYTRTASTCSFASATGAVATGTSATKSYRSVSESETFPTGSRYCQGPASTEYSACAIGDVASRASNVA